MEIDEEQLQEYADTMKKYLAPVYETLQGVDTEEIKNYLIKAGQTGYAAVEDFVTKMSQVMRCNKETDIPNDIYVRGGVFYNDQLILEDSCAEIEGQFAVTQTACMGGIPVLINPQYCLPNTGCTNGACLQPTVSEPEEPETEIPQE